MSEKILTEKQGHLYIITINRPEKKNAFDIDILKSLSAAYTELSNNDDLRCGIVRAEGDCFTAGLDLADVMPKLLQGGMEVFLEKGNCDPYRNFGPACSKPIITAVHGLCLTAGTELALAADLCIAADNTQFGQPEVTRGIIPFGGASFRLPALMGWHNAARYMFTGELFSAQKALDFGLVQELTDLGKQTEKAVELGEKIARNAPLAVQALLRQARKATELPKELTAELLKETVALAGTEDAKEGVMSMMQKRAPNFTGK